MPNNELQTKITIPPVWTPDAIRSFLSDQKLIQGKLTVATSDSGQETVRQEFSRPPLVNGISGPAFPPITMEWDKRELEEAIFPSNSQQKIHSGDYLALHFRSGNTAEFIDKTVNTRELEGKRSLYEFNANIKVDGSSITPKDPGIILSLPSNHNYTQSQLGDMSRLIKNGLFVKGTLSDINQDAIRDITRPELHISTSSTVLSTLEQLGIVHEDSTEGMVPIINTGVESEFAAFNVPLVAFKPQRLMRGTNMPMADIHLLVPASSVQSIGTQEELDNTAVNFRIKSKDSEREPLGYEAQTIIATNSRTHPSMIFIPGIRAEAFRTREAPAPQSSLSTHAGGRVAGQDMGR